MTTQRGQRRHERGAVKRARQLSRQIQHESQRIDELARERLDAEGRRAAAERELLSLHRDECERLGVSLPYDPILLDVVALIEVEDGGIWRWRGTRNNYGSPTFRMPGGKEWSVPKFLATALGYLPNTETEYLLRPGNGYETDDMNPAHRMICVVRRGRLGNPDRFNAKAEQP